MAASKSKRRSRKGRGGSPQAPRAVASTRREERAGKLAARPRPDPRADRLLGTVGERPAGPFGFPVSEILILIGIVGLIVGVIQGGGPVLLVGVIVIALGVFEFTMREHFTGFRSHTSLLAGVPALIVEVVIVSVFGVPKVAFLIFLPVFPVFALSFWLLRRAFVSARHTRVTRAPSA